MQVAGIDRITACNPCLEGPAGGVDFTQTAWAEAKPASLHFYGAEEPLSIVVGAPAIGGKAGQRESLGNLA